MDFWQSSLAVGGTAAIGAFVLFSLYNKWLELTILERLTRKQIYRLMMAFLFLTFISFALTVYAYIISSSRCLSKENEFVSNEVGNTGELHIKFNTQDNNCNSSKSKANIGIIKGKANVQF